VKRAAAWLLISVYVVLAAGALALIAFQDASTDAIGSALFGAFAGVGALIALRQPGNAVGWILLAIAIAFAGVETGQVYIADPSNPGRVPVAWLASVLGNLWFALAVIFLPLLFPHGRLPSPRWRPVLWLGVADLVIGGTAAALKPGPLELVDATAIENPLGVENGLPELLGNVDIVVGGLGVILGGSAVIVRFRRSRGTERQQLKWFAYVGTLAAACLSTAVLFGSVLGGGAGGGYGVVAAVAWLSGLALLGFGLPAATGIAIFRHRLYDVDVVIRRTLVYAALTATLGASYLGLVLLAGLAVGRSNVAIAISTLAVAALFRPALRRIQAAVDRRFYSRRYDAALTQAAFGARLRDQVELDAISGDLRGVVRDAVQPAHVSLWLRSTP
jgi:hypothetical protein